MNDIINKFLLAGDKFIPEVYRKQRTSLDKSGFSYSACGPYAKNKERIQKFKETGDTKYIYKNEFDKACFQHDMACGDFKDSAKRTAADKKLRKRKVYSSFKDNIWGADLEDVQSISKSNKEFRLLLCVIDIFRKYVGLFL